MTQIKINSCISCNENNWSISYTGENKTRKQHHLPVCKCKNCGYKMPIQAGVFSPIPVSDFVDTLSAQIANYNYGHGAKQAAAVYELTRYLDKSWKLQK